MNMSVTVQDRHIFRPSRRTTTSSQHARPSGVLRCRSDGLECAAWRPSRPVAAQCRQFPEETKDASVSEYTWTLSALEALRNALYKFMTYLLTYNAAIAVHCAATGKLWCTEQTVTVMYGCVCSALPVWYTTVCLWLHSALLLQHCAAYCCHTLQCTLQSQCCAVTAFHWLTSLLIT